MRGQRRKQEKEGRLNESWRYGKMERRKNQGGKMHDEVVKEEKEECGEH